MKARLRIFSLVMKRIDGRNIKNIKSNEKWHGKEILISISEGGDIGGERDIKKKDNELRNVYKEP